MLVNNHNMEEIRKKLDQVDYQILKLLKQRKELVLEIAQIFNCIKWIL